MRQEKIWMYADQLFDWLIHFVPNFIGAMFILMIGWWLIGKMDTAFSNTMKKRNYEVSLIAFLQTLFSFGSKTILVIIVAGQIGFQTTSLAAIIGAVGLAVGLALQGSLSNLAGGVLILIFKPYKVGDVISTSTFTGKVQEIQIFNTILLLNDHKTVMLPNGPISNGAVINNNKQSAMNIRLRVKIPAIDYSEILINDLKDFLNRDNLLEKQSGIDIYIREINRPTLTLEAKLWCKPSDVTLVHNHAMENLYQFYAKYNYLEI